jgi:hypothetical protein
VPISRPNARARCTRKSAGSAALLVIDKIGCLPVTPGGGTLCLHAVEGFFAKLTKHRLKRGVFARSSISKPRSKASAGKSTTIPALRVDRGSRANHRFGETWVPSARTLEPLHIAPTPPLPSNHRHCASARMWARMRKFDNSRHRRKCRSTNRHD